MKNPGTPTIAEVAASAGVSVATASRALGGYGRVSEKTVASVRAAAQRIGYRPNRLAQSMITGRTNTIGVVCADVLSPFFAGVVRGITDAAAQAGYSVIITNSDERLDSEIATTQLLLDQRVDGLVLSPADVRRVAHLKKAIDQGTPIVMVDRASSACPTDAVLIDGPGATRDAVLHLFEKGHRRVAIAAELSELPQDFASSPLALERILDQDPFSVTPSLARLGGYLAAHRRAEVPIDPSLILRSGEYSAASAFRAVDGFFGGGGAADALIAVDNTMSLGAFRALRAAGKRVPADISFIGFDNLDWTELVEPPVSVIAQPVYEIGFEAARMLIDRMSGNVHQPRIVQLPATFIERGSVAER